MSFVSKHQRFFPILMMIIGVALIIGAVLFLVLSTQASLARFSLATATADTLANSDSATATADSQIRSLEAATNEVVQDLSSLPTSPVGIPYPEIPRVSLEDAKAAFDSGTAVFVDVRGESSFAQSHIPGAISMTEADLPDHMDDLDRSSWIITYCT